MDNLREQNLSPLILSPPRMEWSVASLRPHLHGVVVLLFTLSTLVGTGCSNSSVTNETTSDTPQNFPIDGPGESAGFPTLALGGGTPYQEEPDAGGELLSDTSNPGEDGSGEESPYSTDADASGEEGPVALLPEDCNNGVDDDGDDETDCADPDCALSPLCTPAAENCFNGVDDDGDGAKDCQDSDCEDVPACAPEDCSNFIDDDNDGFADCLDTDCVFTSACQEGDCGDGLDGDGDGFADCLDSECALAPKCIENICGDGLDNDGDGLADCDDVDCADDLVCTEFGCLDGIDNNGDGLVDCADPDCKEAPGCTGETCTDFYACLLESGCGCTQGVDCPDVVSSEGSACQANCVESGGCWEGCLSTLSPYVLSNLNKWLACQETHCADAPVTETTACVNANCIIEYAECFAAGSLPCSHYGFECGENCVDAACEEACFQDLSPAGTLDALTWDDCRYSLCDQNGDNAPDSLECIYLASLYACADTAPSCLPVLFEGGGGSCGALMTCALECPITDESCHLTCIENATFTALEISAEIFECAIIACGTETAALTPECIDAAIASTCSTLAESCE